MAMMTKKERHRGFQEDLIWSEPTRLLIARWLLQNKRAVYLEPLRVAPRWEDRRYYSDNGDIYVGKDFGTLKRVEARGLSINFTCAADYPYRTFFVGQKHKWDKADPKPVTYFYLSCNRTHIAILHTDTHAQWKYKPNVFTGNSQIHQGFYECALNLVQFHPFHVLSCEEQIEMLL